MQPAERLGRRVQHLDTATLASKGYLCVHTCMRVWESCVLVGGAGLWYRKEEEAAAVDAFDGLHVVLSCQCPVGITSKLYTLMDQQRMWHVSSARCVFGAPIFLLLFRQPAARVLRQRPIDKP